MSHPYSKRPLHELERHDGQLVENQRRPSSWRRPLHEGALRQARNRTEAVDVSIVVPVFNEKESLDLLYTQLAEALASLELCWEVIFVDDGSTDGSFGILRDIQQQDARVHVVRFRRNFGQTAAFSAGFDYADADVIVTMDADLQNDPADIPVLIEKLAEGYDIVSGWRKDRQDPFFSRRLPSQIANFLISKITGVELHDYGCSLKAYHRDVVDNIKLYGELHRFIPALASWMGIRVAEVPVRHSPRKFGRSKYGLSRTLKVVLDLITVKFFLDYATRPIQIFGLLGMFSLAVGTGLGLYLSATKIFLSHPLRDRPMLLLAVLLVVLGVQFITMGLLGELSVRTYYESQDKPTYMVRTLLGFDRTEFRDSVDR